ncbi:MAG: peptide-methionine (S)-S-oxide reductase MsrA [Candidatus Micrarchaeota archaeon]|nr:peptide-methionine (S)-S-oxide reductase MsrA [Candidatus Micrarchaeota archaeon]
MGRTEAIVFGGGCFWCTEAVFTMFEGVVSAVSGYAGGHVPNPTYEQVCSGRTGHAEVLRIEYDPERIPLEKLLDVFFDMHDPTTPNRQGPDEGSQYRSMILYESDGQRQIIDKSIEKAQRSFQKPIVTEVRKLDRFYPAEDYHQDYYRNNPLQPYCLIVIGPKVRKIKKKYGLK